MFAARFIPPLVAAGLTVVTGTAVAQQTSLASNTILISGSSTVYPFSVAAIAATKAQRPKGVTFKATSVGTSAGFRDFCSGKLSIAAASRPINADELKRCAAAGVRFIELPVAFDAITVVVNAKNTFAKQISTAQLSALWNRKAQGRIQSWNQVNPAWPKATIKLCGPGKDSGTYDTFNKANVGLIDLAQTGEDDNVLVNCVANNPGALGYFGYDYYQANRSRLRALAVQGSVGTVLPSVESVQSSRYLPLSRPLFFYVNDQALKRNPAIRTMISATLQRGVRIAEQAGVIPLQDSTYRLVTNKLYRNVLGSAFAGNLPIGLTVGQILERSFDQHKKAQFR